MVIDRILQTMPASAVELRLSSFGCRAGGNLVLLRPCAEPTLPDETEKTSSIACQGLVFKV